MKKINSWDIEKEDASDYQYPHDREITFDEEDFETWWLYGMTREDKILKKHQRELYENCLYLAESEHSRMTQTATKLKRAIAWWAEDWNKKL